MSRRSSEGEQRRLRNLNARIGSAAFDYLPVCNVPDRLTGQHCGRPTARAAKIGLSAFTCRLHQAHLQRHGSHWCKSPSAATLRPYLKAACSFIAAHRDDPFVGAALEGFRGLMETAGPVEIATRLRGLPPKRRAQIALARLREAAVAPARLLAISLAVAALIEDAPASVHRTRQWRIVAVAKAAHRLASGTHRLWELRDDKGNVASRTEMHAYPPSSGRVLRHLGEALVKESELAIEHHLSDVLALKAARTGVPS